MSSNRIYFGGEDTCRAWMLADGSAVNCRLLARTTALVRIYLMAIYNILASDINGAESPVDRDSPIRSHSASVAPSEVARAHCFRG